MKSRKLRFKWLRAIYAPCCFLCGDTNQNEPIWFINNLQVHGVFTYHELQKCGSCPSVVATWGLSSAAEAHFVPSVPGQTQPSSPHPQPFVSLDTISTGSLGKWGMDLYNLKITSYSRRSPSPTWRIANLKTTMLPSCIGPVLIFWTWIVTVLLVQDDGAVAPQGSSPKWELPFSVWVNTSLMHRHTVQMPKAM